MLAGAAGCDDDGVPGGADAAPTADAPPGPPADARTDCPVPRTFIAPPAVSAGAVKDAAGVITVELELDTLVPPDRLQVRLVAGRGPFIDGVMPGQFSLSGNQLQNQFCALCLMVLADVDGAGVPAEVYFATDGILELEAVSGQLTGRLIDVGFEHVTLASGPPYASTPVDDGCVTRVSSLTFDVAITGP